MILKLNELWATSVAPRPLQPSPSSTVSHMTTYYILLHASSLLYLRGWDLGDAKGEGLLLLADGQAKLAKNETVPCSTAPVPPPPGLNMKPHHVVLFTECRILRDWVFLLPVTLFSRKPTHTLSSILHWMNRLCSLLCSRQGEVFLQDVGAYLEMEITGNRRLQEALE